jgi:hypothetical protein
MKLERKGTPATISGAVSGPQQFNIAGSRIAFNILSSGLYSNKIQACIRELSCNAWDAHVMADKRDLPFEIHIPSSFEPWFTVKDFGIGLNPAAPFIFQKMVNPDNGNEYTVRIGKFTGEKLEKDQFVQNVDELIDLYCTYFQSNKNDSNDVIGAMGLGSKSPFCYTEGFTVTSRYNGVTRIASAYITEQGTPSIVVQSTEETPDAVNGLEVTFPVKENDCWEFENNAKVALEFFTDPAPVMTGEQVKVIATQYVMKTDRWGMRADAATHQGTGMRAIQGKVAYAVGKIDISKMGPELQALTQMPLDLFFPIGELAVAASREALQLDPNTVANINKALEDVYTGLVAEVKKEIDKCKQPWEARLLIFRLINAPGTGSIINEALNKGKLFGAYKNFSLQDKKPTLNELDFNHTQIYKFKHNNRSAKYAGKSSVFSRVTLENRALAAQELRNGTKLRKDFARDFEVENDICFVINDLKFGGEKYIHFFLQEAQDNKTVKDENTEEITVQAKETVYLFSRINKDHTQAQVMKETMKMIEILGNPPTVLMSELKARYSQFVDIKVAKPTTPKEKRDIVEMNLSAEGRKLAYSHRRSENIPWCNLWTRSDSQPDGTKFYVVQVENVATESGFASAKSLIEFVKYVKASGKFGLTKDAAVYGLKPKSVLRNDPEWVELTSHVMSSVSKVMTKSKEMELSLLLKPFRVYDWEEALDGAAKDASFPQDSPFKKFADTLALARRNAKTPANEALVKVLEVAKARENPKTKKPFYTDHNALNFENGWTEIKKMYPMLNLSSRSYYSGNGMIWRVVGQYVRLVDAAAAVPTAVAVGATV